jgi:hypothetical protein
MVQAEDIDTAFFWLLHEEEGDETLRSMAKSLNIPNYNFAPIVPIVAHIPEYEQKPFLLSACMISMIPSRLSAVMLWLPVRDKHLPHAVSEWWSEHQDDYNDICEALLREKLAIVAVEDDMLAAQAVGWKGVLDEVKNGVRSTNFDGAVHEDISIEESSNILELANRILSAFQEESWGLEIDVDIGSHDEDFTESFKEEWE